MEGKKILSFDVDASQIDIKPLLKKEFLELTMRAISTANPNRNNSWFTKESLIASIGTFKNKPILGYFENGDFVSHNGQWKKDPETRMEYWDTLDTKGERPIGIIRSEDEVKVVDDEETGLSWACLTCALWTQYNYKQVKRLLKDAKKAKEQGGPTKNISVEVDITDYEYLENGVMKINAFNLVGITILGSRNGVKVEPGIEDAELSVVDIMGTDLYAKQLQSLRLAYEKLDGSETNNKEDFSEMELENQTNSELENTATENTLVNTEADSVTNPEEGSQHFENQNENGSEQEDGKEPKHENHEEGGDVCPECGKNPCECESKKEQEGCKEQEECGNEDHVHQNEESQGEVQDITWLVEKLSGAAEYFEYTIRYYEDFASDIEGSDYIIPVLKRIHAQTVENEKELIGLLAKVAEGLTEEEKQFAKDLVEHCDCKKEFAAYNELLSKYNAYSEDYENLRVERDGLKSKFEEIEKAEAHQKFMEEAKAVIGSAHLTDELVASFSKECEEGTIITIEDLKVKIGLKLFELQQNVKVEEQKPAEENTTATFDAPINTPDTTTFIEENRGQKKTKWETLHEYIGK